MHINGHSSQAAVMIVYCGANDDWRVRFNLFQIKIYCSTCEQSAELIRLIHMGPELAIDFNRLNKALNILKRTIEDRALSVLFWRLDRTCESNLAKFYHAFVMLLSCLMMPCSEGMMWKMAEQDYRGSMHVRIGHFLYQNLQSNFGN